MNKKTLPNLASLLKGQIICIMRHELLFRIITAPKKENASHNCSQSHVSRR